MGLGGEGSSPGQFADAHALAAALEPALRDRTGGRLSPVEWFHASWQRGGACTGFARWRADFAEIPVFVKLPVGPGELRWTASLGSCDLGAWDDPTGRALSTPRVLASGDALAGHDLAWLITERFEGPPLTAHVDEHALRDILRAAVDFQSRATPLAPIDSCPIGPNWDWLVDHGRRAARAGALPEPQRWNEALKRVHRALPLLAARWHRRGFNTWCHGDVHPGNAMRRAAVGNAPGPCVLIDLALVHPGHWIEDALYLERQFWGHESYLHGLKPVSELARMRREAGLGTEGDYNELANIRRVLAAAAAPAMIDREGNPKYLHSALEHIEKLLPQVVHHH